LPPLRGGAGLDLDLADPRQRERLPAELRQDLPAKGFVNLPEAQAVIRLLENLIADLPAPPAERPTSVAVLAPYEAQAALVGRLMRDSQSLAISPVAVHVAAVGKSRQREADVVLVPLTRSHTHRAVSYGDEPSAMPLALTRARQRLVLIGDPGTLARRAQWDGPVEHLDAEAAKRERDWVAALVRLLQGNGPTVIHLREGPP
jgi:superfamily I DNA and/or RNA helicase